MTEIIEPSDEIKNAVRALARNTPDVLDGDCTEDEVYDHWLDLFRRHGREVCVAKLRATAKEIDDMVLDCGCHRFVEECAEEIER